MPVPAPDDRILGIDPGVARVGYALVIASRRPTLVACGTLVTPAGREAARRLADLARGLRRLLERTRPSRVAFERVFFQRNVSTALAVSEARGVLRLVCAEANLPASEFTPTAIKQAVTGHGRADKRAMLKMIRLLLGPTAPRTDDDAADAAAIALTAALQRLPHGS